MNHSHDSHEHHHSHSHSHSKGHAPKLVGVFFLTATYLVAELIGGWWSGSLALLADAGHMATDSLALFLSLFAVWVAKKPATDSKTFGYHRAEILAALANGTLLSFVAFWILYEAWVRLNHPIPVGGEILTWVAVGGLLVNLVSMKLLHAHSKDSLNLRGVWLHVFFDFLGSVVAIGAGLCVWKFDLLWADAASSIFLSALILWGSWRLISDCVHDLLQGVPRGVDLGEIRTAMRRANGVVDVFDLHCWSVRTGVFALSAHVAVKDGVSQPTLLKELGGILHDRFQIHHSTLQLEPENFHAEASGAHCEMG